MHKQQPEILFDSETPIWLMPADLDMPEQQQEKKEKFKSLGTLKSAMICAGLALTVEAANLIDSYVQAHFAPHAGWTAQGECLIEGTEQPGNLKTLSVNLHITGDATAVFQQCREVFNREGFTLWNIEANFSKSISGLKGMDDKLGSAVNGNHLQLGFSEDEPAKQKLEERVLESRALQQEWKGVAFTSDWYAYQGLKAKQAVVETAQTGWSKTVAYKDSVIDKSVATLQSLKQPSP